MRCRCKREKKPSFLVSWLHPLWGCCWSALRRLWWHVLSDNNPLCMSCSLFWPCTFLPTILPLCHHMMENIEKIVLKRNMPVTQQENPVKNCNSKKVSVLCSPIVWKICARRIKNKILFLRKFRPIFIKNFQYFVQKHECNLFKSITYCDATVWIKADVFLVFNVQISPIYSSNHT